MTAGENSPSSSGPTRRLFIALTLPEAVREALADLPERHAGMAWTRPEQLHVTLRFLGNVAVDRIDTMVGRLEGVHVEPFVLPLENLGTFPPNRPPRVLWLGTGSGHPRLFQLRQRIDDALIASAIEVDLRTFHPHVTLARCAEGSESAVSHWLHAHRDFAAPPFRVEAFDLYASELRPGGAIHTRLHRFPLA